MAGGGINEEPFLHGVLPEFSHVGAVWVENNGDKLSVDEIFVSDIDQHDSFPPDSQSQ